MNQHRLFYPSWKQMNDVEYLKDEIELGLFKIICLETRSINKEYCRKHRQYQPGDWSMTPQEELHSKLFAAEKVFVKDMDDLTLRAHREELASIAFEARARLSAIDWEERERKGKKRSSITGFDRSVNTDDVSSDAINAVNRRRERLSKAEKTRQGLINMGLSDAEADAIMSARNIRDTISAKNTASGTVNPPIVEVKPLINPFEKLPIKVDVETESASSLQGGVDSTNSTSSTNSVESVKPFVNPFAKKEK